MSVSAALLDVAKLRAALSLTQSQLAALLGVHSMTISKWERREASPAPYNVQQLVLLAEGEKRTGPDERERFAFLVAVGLSVGALAFACGLALPNTPGWPPA